MAPSTNIGAAHPVDSSGSDIQGDLRLKAENDAVAHIVNIAKARGRNEQWAEDAVRKSVSIGADEAVQIHVADLIASDVPDLLTKIDGRKVTTAAGTVTLVRTRTGNPTPRAAMTAPDFGGGPATSFSRSSSRSSDTMCVSRSELSTDTS